MRILKSIRTQTKAASDDALIAAIAQGDMAAFEQIYSKYFPKLVRFSKRITGSQEAAEEVTNDVLMTVWRTAARFEGRSKVSTWIFGIAYRMSLKQSRKISARRGDVELDEGMVSDNTNVADAVITKTDLAWALKQLNPDLRAVVELTYYNGYLYTEIAEILGCPVGTVKTRMMTARRRLRAMLSEDINIGSENAVA
ncbi:sigma-70 family RNA polymerase sigma factor [Cognatiyoonia sp. IB215446]|uniref:RNA polymerase sigma factor n=1 Tax=Cognatiyoonia sp. IB215446 TaxID=3097355 RepID=UPI002A12B9C6|nr:sigma-70 family RNA polymerase sigma factor [Cognatiyoonia sp. IB215446]MDX8346893.1 sigma-70 family RNA polymerase sigma factor [Cognatiyoonia sp. IB215446]